MSAMVHVFVGYDDKIMNTGCGAKKFARCGHPCYIVVVSFSVEVLFSMKFFRLRKNGKYNEKALPRAISYETLFYTSLPVAAPVRLVRGHRLGEQESAHWQLSVSASRLCRCVACAAFCAIVLRIGNNNTPNPNNS